MTAESYLSSDVNLRVVAPARPALPGPANVGIIIIVVVLITGMATAGDYGISIDEFNTEDYGRKALAWYTSGFRARASFEAVDRLLCYSGPSFQILIAWVQSWLEADPLTIRHALTFALGLCG